MTEEERGKKFMEGLHELERLYGVTVQFKLEPESFGTMVQVKLVHGLALIEGWTPPISINLGEDKPRSQDE